MSPDGVRSFFHALSEGRIDDLAAVLAPDVVLEFPGARFGGVVEGRRRVLVFLRQNQRLFRHGLRFEVRWAGVVDDRAIAEWTNVGTTRDGVRYENRGCSVFRLEGEHVTRIADYLDTERIATTWPA